MDITNEYVGIACKHAVKLHHYIHEHIIPNSMDFCMVLYNEVSLVPRLFLEEGERPVSQKKVVDFPNLNLALH